MSHNSKHNSPYNAMSTIFMRFINPSSETLIVWYNVSNSAHKRILSNKKPILKAQNIKKYLHRRINNKRTFHSPMLPCQIRTTISKRLNIVVLCRIIIIFITRDNKNWNCIHGLNGLGRLCTLSGTVATVEVIIIIVTALCVELTCQPFPIPQYSHGHMWIWGRLHSRTLLNKLFHFLRSAQKFNSNLLRLKVLKFTIMC